MAVSEASRESHAKARNEAIRADDTDSEDDAHFCKQSDSGVQPEDKENIPSEGFTAKRPLSRSSRDAEPRASKKVKTSTVPNRSNFSIADDTASVKDALVRSDASPRQCVNCQHCNCINDECCARRFSQPVTIYNQVVGARNKTYNVGDIVRVPHVVPNMDANQKAFPEEGTSTEDIIFTKTLGHLCTKIRPAIVVAVFPENLLTLPVHSCGGTGLRYRGKHYVRSALLLPREVDVAGLTQEERNMSLFLTGWEPTKPGSHVRLEEMYFVETGWPLKTNGSLEKLSCERLKLLLERFMLRGMGEDSEKDWTTWRQSLKDGMGDVTKRHRQNGIFALPAFEPNGNPASEAAQSQRDRQGNSTVAGNMGRLGLRTIANNSSRGPFLKQATQKNVMLDSTTRGPR